MGIFKLKSGYTKNNLVEWGFDIGFFNRKSGCLCQCTFEPKNDYIFIQVDLFYLLQILIHYKDDLEVLTAAS